jgi:hypothetical protein
VLLYLCGLQALQLGPLGLRWGLMLSEWAASLGLGPSSWHAGGLLLGRWLHWKVRCAGPPSCMSSQVQSLIAWGLL